MTYVPKPCQSEKHIKGTFMDGSQPLFLPGTKEFFTLKRHKDKTRKEYKCIVFSLRSNDDVTKSSSFEENLHTDDDSNDECVEHSQK